MVECGNQVKKYQPNRLREREKLARLSNVVCVKRRVSHLAPATSAQILSASANAPMSAIAATQISALTRFASPSSTA